MDLHVAPELEAKLNRLAAESGRNVDQVALDLLNSLVDHAEWFRRESNEAAPRLATVGCWTMTRSPLASTRATVPDARPLDV
jgi:hypothetical protein